MERARGLLLTGLLLVVAACGQGATDALDALYGDIGFAVDAPDPGGSDAPAPPDDGRSDPGSPDLGAESATDDAPVRDADAGGPDGVAPDHGSAEPLDAIDAAPDLAEIEPACECGDGACVTAACGETAFSCPDDCCVCGDDACVPVACGESPDSCPADCALWVCGNDTCEPGETLATCPVDCGDGTCGNGACEPGEDATSCPADCSLPCGACDDADPCTVDGCDGLTGLCTHAPTPSTGAPDATCNGHDDDCDGATDEDYAPSPTTCGGGPCAATGLLACQGGAVVDTCAPLPGLPEACNGVDDDCDGQLDEACPCPVVSYDGHAYQFCTGADRWNGAREACDEFAGYHLVTLDDAAENAWVAASAATFSNAPWWIGLNDREKEGEWRWTDGQAPSFTAWAEGEPNNSWGNEDCAELTPGAASWNDEGCNEFQNYVCEHAP